MDRPSWDEYFMAIAEQVSRRSTCLRRHVGAVLVVDRRILATGYNGAPSGVPHCAESGCLREQMAVPSGQRHELCRGLHAEQNAIIQAAKHGVRIAGAMLYTTHHPCSMCAKACAHQLRVDPRGDRARGLPGRSRQVAAENGRCAARSLQGG